MQATYLAGSPPTHRTDPTDTSRAEKTATVTRVRCLEHEMFEDSGHIRRSIGPATAERMNGAINDLRRTLGWLEIDLEGRWRWPNTVG